MLPLTLLYSILYSILYKRFPRNNSSDFPAERSQLESYNRNLHSMPRNKRHSSAVVEKVFFLEVRPVFCYWINPRPPLDAFYRPTLIEMSLENGCARVLFNRPRWFFSFFFLPSRWSFVIVPFFLRLRSRERPSRTSANYDYLQLEISKGRKRRKEVDSPFPRVFESISKESYSQSSSKFRKESLSRSTSFFFGTSIHSQFPTKNMILI